MTAPMYNALAARTAPVAQPVAKPTPAAKPVTATEAPPRGFNAKPDKDANSGQSPAMTGDRQRIQRPAVHAIPSTAQPRPQEQRSGMETAMGALADQLHKPRRR
jgi:hypothetical protein